MSGMIDRRIANAEAIADWFKDRGSRDRAGQMRGIMASLAQFRTAHRDIQRLRKQLTPISQARLTERRAGLIAELVTSADQLERLAKIADTGGEGQVGVEVPDAAYLVDLLRRAAL